MAPATFKLDLAEQFPRLSRPPIIEAAIHWQARAQKPLEPEALRATLAQKLPGYPSCQPIQHVEMMAMISDHAEAPVVQRQKDWGLRLTSDDNPHVVQFTRDGVVFSRMQPYQDWDRFSVAAKRVWSAFVEIAAPLEIQRLGVRFINHMPTATAGTLMDFLRDPPTCPANLPLNEFVYQSTFTVPEQPYGIRVIKVMQPSISGLPQSSGLFIDCDVFTTKPISCEARAVDEALVQMRWLKNKVFFTLLSAGAVNLFV